jgi:predicted transcriptional regulator of viral defense system
MKALAKRYRPAIDSYFSENPYETFTPKEISNWIAERQKERVLPKTWTIKAIIDELVAGSWLRQISLTSDLYDSKTRFATNAATAFRIGLSLRNGSYLSHSSAAYLNSLIEEEPSAIYVNKEQAAKKTNVSLSQESIDRAFTRLPRSSKYCFWHMENKPNPIQFVILSGKNTQDLGVEWKEHPKAGRIRVSNLERTLIDIAVRPHYSGGLQSVLRVYGRSKPHVDLKRLVYYLRELKYSYPYHQAIGFLMTKAGFERTQYQELRKLGFQFRFYLAHGIKDALFDSEWNVYYPQDLDRSSPVNEGKD